MKTLVVTEKKSVADDFARVLGGFKPSGQRYEREDMVIAWASGHLLELQDPSAYDDRYKRWLLQDLPILPERFVRVPRGDNARSRDLLKGLVSQMRRKDVDQVVNACDAGREGELIFNLIADHAGISSGTQKGQKTVRRLWLQSMTKSAIQRAFDEVQPAEQYIPLRNAAYARDEADWLVGMNGTRAFTRKFMGRARSFMAVGRVKTPTLAFLVDREREIDRFVPVSYHQVDAVFDTGNGTYQARWTGLVDGKRVDRLPDRGRAEEIERKVAGQRGQATDKATTREEMPPLLYDLTTLQREASNRFGYTLDRTLSIAQSLYEARKAITYPRTSSRYLPSDYGPEIPRLVGALRGGPLAAVVDAALKEAGGAIENLHPVKRDRVFNDRKVSDHFALIPTGENPINLREDERRIYDMIVRRFFAVFLPKSRWSHIARDTVVSGESFMTREKRLVRAGWRAVEPQPDHEDLPALPEDGAVGVVSVEILDKATQPPSRYTDGSLVKAMETAGQDIDHPADAEEDPVLDDLKIEELKEKGIGTPATRAAIVKDLIQKHLARRSGRNILATPLGCNLVRLVRDLDLDVLAKPDLTGDWEYKLAQVAEGAYPLESWQKDIREQVQGMVSAIKDLDGGSEQVFSREHRAMFGDQAGKLLVCRLCGAPLVEKTFSYMCSSEDCEGSISKDQKGKYLFPETLVRLLSEGRAGPLTGFEGTRAAGTFVLAPDGHIEIDFPDGAEAEEVLEGEEGTQRREEVPEGLEVGKCPKCGSVVKREGRGYRCVKNIARKKDKECDFRVAERIKYRYLPLAEIRKMLTPGGKTEQLFGFVSMRGRKFKAQLYYDAEGELKWEFPPRAAKKPGAKKAAKKTAKKKAVRKKPAAKTAKTAKKATKKVAKKATKKGAAEPRAEPPAA